MIRDDVVIGEGTKVIEPVNLYGCKIGKNCLIGPFVEIQEGVTVGDGSRIQSHTFICEGVEIGEKVFVGHGVMFINDRHPELTSDGWKLERTVVEYGASIGSNATILPSVIGRGSMVGAGSVVTKNVPPKTVVAGNPAKVLK